MSFVRFIPTDLGFNDVAICISSYKFYFHAICCWNVEKLLVFTYWAGI